MVARCLWMLMLLFPDPLWELAKVFEWLAQPPTRVKLSWFWDSMRRHRHTSINRYQHRSTTFLAGVAQPAQLQARFKAWSAFPVMWTSMPPPCVPLRRRRFPSQVVEAPASPPRLRGLGFSWWAMPVDRWPPLHTPGPFRIPMLWQLLGWRSTMPWVQLARSLKWPVSFVLVSQLFGQLPWPVESWSC